MLERGRASNFQIQLSDSDKLQIFNNEEPLRHNTNLNKLWIHRLSESVIYIKACFF